ncbi:protein of unknown function (plasmid) [Paraburkholderia kururiensis]
MPVAPSSSWCATICAIRRSQRRQPIFTATRCSEPGSLIRRSPHATASSSALLRCFVVTATVTQSVRYRYGLESARNSGMVIWPRRAGDTFADEIVTVLVRSTHAARRCAGFPAITEITGHGGPRVQAGVPAAQCGELRVVREVGASGVDGKELACFHDRKFISKTMMDR